MVYVFFSSSAQYFASTMMIVGLSVVVTVLVLQFHHHDPHGGKMPKWVCTIINKLSIGLLRITPYTNVDKCE